MLARAERFGWYNAGKTEEGFALKKQSGRSWEKLCQKTRHQMHHLVVYNVSGATHQALSLSFSLSLSPSTQLMGSTFPCLALPGLDSATMRAKSLTTVAGISSHSSDRV